MKDKDIFDFVHAIFGTSGNCTGYCEVCKKSYPACGGDLFVKGECPDSCNGYNGHFLSITNDWSGRQVGECCFEKVFRPLKIFLDNKSFSILRYYSQEIEEEEKELKNTKELLKKYNIK